MRRVFQDVTLLLVVSRIALFVAVAGGKFRGTSVGASCGDFDRNRVAEEPMLRLEFGIEAGR